MAAITFGPLQAITQPDITNPPPETAILFVVVSLFVGILSRQVLQKTKVPYTVVLLLIGMGLGTLEYGTRRGLGALGHSIQTWSNINPDLILYVYLPALLFESSFSMEFHQIKRCSVQMLLLAFPGVMISTACLGLVHYFIFPYGWSWSICLLLGGLLSATDPVAVVSLLKEVGASKKLGTIIEGESLMNDGTAMVVFELFRRMVLGTHFSFGDIVQFLCQVALGAVALGIAFGLLSVIWVGFMFNDTVMEITLTFTASYCAFFIAQSVAGISGVLAVMSVGIFMGAFARTAFRGESQQSMHHFWTIIAYFANTIIFILSGVVIAESFLRSQAHIQGRDWGYLFVLYIFLQLSRAVVVLFLYPGLSYYGYGLSAKEAVVLVWAGLRGAVALALSLSIHDTDQSKGFTEATQAKFVFFTGGVVFLTLTINGSTTQFLLHYLRIEKTSETKRLVLEHVRYEMNKRATEAFEELGEDEELGPAEWTTVQKYIGCLNSFPEQQRPVHPHQISDDHDDLLQDPSEETRKIQLQDTRLRFLNGVQAVYWEMLEEGRITQTAAILLMQSVDEALDRVVDHECLVDWKGLHPHVNFPGYLKHLQIGTSWLPNKLLTYLIVERLELGCYISAAFLRAHITVRRHLRDFIGETEVSMTVIKESEDEAVEAKQFLEDIRMTFSQVLRVVKTKQVVHAILLRLLDYVESLEKSGFLEEKETLPLHNALQGELKKLLRKPPSVKMPKGAEVSNSQPFMTMLPPHVQPIVVNSAKEYIKIRGSHLYKEGTKADGVWLIASGVVKWSKGEAVDKHLLHPTFSHGSTLGLYEVLTGKPYLCDIIADSVVQCFFVDGAKLLSILESEPPGLEHLFWQESTLAVSKILFPQFFEAMPIQELRVHVQSLSLLSFLRGEIVEIGPGEAGILLEGFVKTDGKDELIGAPSGLIFQKTNNSNSSPRGPFFRPSIHYGNVFHMETRCRLIIFANAATHSARAASSSSLLPRRSSLGDSSFTLKSRRRNSDQRRNSDAQFIGLTPPGPDHKPAVSKSAGVQWRGSTGQILQQTPSFTGSQPSQDPVAVQAAASTSGNAESSSAQKLMRSSLPTISTQIPPLAPVRVRRPMRRRSSPSQAESSEKAATETRKDDDSSSDDEEHIIQIESPSSLFHNSFNEQEEKF